MNNPQIKKLCPVNCCYAQINNERFVCLKHWKQLNGQQRKEIYDIYNQYKRGELSMTDFLNKREIYTDILNSKVKINSTIAL